MSDVSKTTKPQLRGLLHNQIKKNIMLALGMCVVAGVAQKFLYNDPKIQVFSDFYKSYDIEKEFNRMRKKGLFESCE